MSIPRVQLAVITAISLAGMTSTTLMAQEARTIDLVSFPSPRLVEGRSWETRPPEKADDKPVFAGQTRAPYHGTRPYTVEVITDRLKFPWSVSFLPDGSFLVTEKNPGALRIVSRSGDISVPLKGISALAPRLGLLDVALARDFTKTHRIFVSFFENLGSGYSNTNIASGILDQENGAVHDVTVIFRAQPMLPAKNFSSKQGGRLAVAKDGSLFMTVGDRDDNKQTDYEAALAQKWDSDIGKVIHIRPDGLPAESNPHLAEKNVRPEIWAIGVRSPEGLVMTPQGQLWEVEHGPRGGDELNLIRRDKNYGWPLVTHGINYTGEPVGAGIASRKDLEEPRYYWDPVIAPSAVTYYHGGLFPDWDGSLLVGALRGKGVFRLKLRGTRVVEEEPLLLEVKNRIRDVREGPDGAVYVLTEANSLLRITPSHKP